MSVRHEADATRDRLQRAILDAQVPMAQMELPMSGSAQSMDLMKAVFASVSLAVLEVAEESDGPAVVPTLDSLEASTQRVADLARLMIAYGGEGGIET